ncbi:MAG: cupin domain-containing protein [Sphingomonadales bacterium]|nr:cupin domain-containing protein [Sphingomonadales bacterium]MDE2168738.1 cupin domain-containing protein [Sphingomonadales bacterium]
MLEQRPIHLGPQGQALVLPDFTGPQWYEEYGASLGAQGAQGRLVSLHHFAADWDHWEMHPQGDEVVICIAGAAVLIQQDGQGRERRIPLETGQCVINPAGVWHTANVAQAASLLFITVGSDTQGRPR